MPGDVRRRCTGVRFTRTQLSQLGGIWDHIALVDPEQETCDGESSVEEDDDSAADSEEDENCEDGEDNEDNQDAAYNDERSGGEDADEDGLTGYEPEDEADEGDPDNDELMDENSEAVPSAVSSLEA